MEREHLTSSPNITSRSIPRIRSGVKTTGDCGGSAQRLSVAKPSKNEKKEKKVGISKIGMGALALIERVIDNRWVPSCIKLGVPLTI